MCLVCICVSIYFILLFAVNQTLNWMNENRMNEASSLCVFPCCCVEMIRAAACLPCLCSCSCFSLCTLVCTANFPVIISVDFSATIIWTRPSVDCRDVSGCRSRRGGTWSVKRGLMGSGHTGTVRVPPLRGQRVTTQRGDRCWAVRQQPWQPDNNETWL